MAIPNLEFLLVIVDLFGPLGDAAFSFPENHGRHLPDNTGQRSTSNPKVSSKVPVNRELTNRHDI